MFSWYTLVHITAGERYNSPGGGANLLCLPEQPEYLSNASYSNIYRSYLDDAPCTPQLNQFK